ncbi:MAG: hypothetical protein PQJ59_12840 [Spirochaetales bacterium]|nr:hypothetical protein [Spirochaetales bacterium]
MNTRETTVKQEADSWDAGYHAGLSGKPGYPVPKGVDSLSWYAGFIEGKADRTKKA